MPTTDVKTSENGVRACPCGAAFSSPQPHQRYCSPRCRRWFSPAMVAKRGGRLTRYQPRYRHAARRLPVEGVVCGLTALDGPDAGRTVWLCDEEERRTA